MSLDKNFQIGETIRKIRVNKIENEIDRIEMKNKIINFARGTSSDEINITSAKGVILGLNDLYFVKKEDEPICVELIKASGGYILLMYLSHHNITF